MATRSTRRRGEEERPDGLVEGLLERVDGLILRVLGRQPRLGVLHLPKQRQWIPRRLLAERALEAEDARRPHVIRRRTGG